MPTGSSAPAGDKSWPVIAPVWLLVLIVILDYLWAGFAALVFHLDWLQPLAEATGGLVHRSLIANIIPLKVLLLSLLLIRRIRPADLGITGTSVLGGVTMTVVLWVFMQAVAMASGVTTGLGMVWHPQWTGPGMATAMGRLVGQLFGNAPYEELVYRSLLFGALLGLLSARRPEQTRSNVIHALLISQAAFLVRHIPAGIREGIGLAELVQWLLVVFVLGCVFALLYQRTRSLAFVVGVHALFNCPTELFASTVPAQLILIATALLIAWKWPRHPRETS